MNKLLILLVLGAITSCSGLATRTANTQADSLSNTVVDIHTAENSLDYVGVYSGTTPAADCPGIEVSLELNSDGSYQITMVYLERDGSFTDRGTYTVAGNELITKEDNNDHTSYYRIGENKLYMLDGDRKIIDGPLAEMYILTKKAK